jgi:hypothetical protein
MKIRGDGFVTSVDLPFRRFSESRFPVTHGIVRRDEYVPFRLCRNHLPIFDNCVHFRKRIGFFSQVSAPIVQI